MVKSISLVAPFILAQVASGADTKPVQASKSDEDSYLWLEDIQGKRALSWVNEQNKDSKSKLESDPRYKKAFDDALALLEDKDRIPGITMRGKHIYNFWQDADHVRGLWRRTDLKGFNIKNAKWETLLDVDALAKKENENWVFKGASCLPPAYERCMLKLSKGGGDAAVRREFDVSTRTFVDNGFNLPEAKQYFTWVDKNRIAVSTDFGKGSLTKSGYPRIVKLWTRGTKLDEAKTLFKGEYEDNSAWPSKSFRPDGHNTFIRRSLSFFSAKYFLVKDDFSLVEIPIPIDAKVEEFFKGEMLVSLRSPWKVDGIDKPFPKGALISINTKDILNKNKKLRISTLYVPDERSSFQSVSATRDAVFVNTLDNVTGVLLRYTMSKVDEKAVWSSSKVEVPEQGRVSIATASSYSNDAFIRYQNFLTPDKLFRLIGEKGELEVVKALEDKFDVKGLSVGQLEATSKDGTKIPYFIVHKKDMKMDGSNPTLLYGYGGFETSMKPFYSEVTGKLWLEKGGVYVLSNIRGGGEFGPKWHQAALKEKRQVAFDDFIAIAEDLISRGITKPKKLGIMGGSNGGLLVGASFTQRPDLFGAVVCSVPLLDMLRYHKLLAGASWMGEYGDPDDPGMRSIIRRYSPYHNLKKNAKYPKVLFVTSTLDDRVHPGHARKMVKKMRDLGHEVLYFENTEGGHSASANLKQAAHLSTLKYIYLYQMLMD